MLSAPVPATVIQNMLLQYREYGLPVSGYPSLLFLHGLFGCAMNWHSIARHFEPDWHVIVPDLRNHGRSPHGAETGYEAMAGDVLSLMDQLGLDRVIPIGHSMGGKVALSLAQQRPQAVERLVLADIAPVAYDNDFADIIAAFRAVVLDQLRTREEADRAMSVHIANPAIRQYLLQNLEQKQGQWRWRINLEGLASSIDQIDGFAPGCTRAYTGPSLIIRGERSDYVLPVHEPMIRQCLPAVHIETLSGVGHWVYAEDPQGFIRLLSGFLG
jgi:pimeloyl-ACP methyl ester carboxylesterase